MEEREMGFLGKLLIFKENEFVWSMIINNIVYSRFLGIGNF